MKMHEKETKVVFGKKHYLLGVKDGYKVWLERANWDCDWYWGLGYVETFNKRYSDINEHRHFDGLFLKRNIFDSFVDYFDSVTLTREEIWKLLELMSSAYKCREYSDMLHTHGAHITTNLCKDLIANDDEYKRINDVVIPSIMKEVYNLLSEDGGEE